MALRAINFLLSTEFDPHTHYKKFTALKISAIGHWSTGMKMRNSFPLSTYYWYQTYSSVVMSKYF
jgi:hypothetical protein